MVASSVVKQVGAMLGKVASKVSLLFWTLFTVTGAVVLGVLTFHLLRSEIVLDVRGVHSTAVVSTTDVGSKTNSMDVRFTPVGKQGKVRAHIERMPWRSLPELGDTVSIEYDPRSPNDARASGDHMYGVFGALAGLFDLWVLWILRLIASGFLPVRRVRLAVRDLVRRVS